ncbi:MAG: hypothetical protein Q9221_000917 [Calogaya cf. arnoldii]
MSANNSALKGVIGSKYKNVGVVPEEQKPDESQRRRQSSSNTKFNGLMGQKRNSADIASTARKASFAEQNKAPGMFGSMWQSFTKGNGSDK